MPRWPTNNAGSANTVEPVSPAAAQAIAETPAPKPVVSQLPRVVAFQLGMPSDLLGSTVTFAYKKDTVLEATALGVIMWSRKSKRKILVPWANIRATEFVWDGA